MTTAEKAKLKKLLHNVIVAKSNYRCEHCGRYGTLHASHIYPEGLYPWMLWWHNNIKSLCFKCHLSWWHKHPLEAAHWFVNKYPIKRQNELREKAYNEDDDTKWGKKWDKRNDYKTIKAELEKQLKKYAKETNRETTPNF